jgi:hypothetical protein
MAEMSEEEALKHDLERQMDIAHHYVNECERLRTLVEVAYREGWRDSENSCNGFYCAQESESWERSQARIALGAEQ